MPAPLLRRYTILSMPATTWTRVHTVVPANRALAISKVTVVNNSGAESRTFHLSIGPNVDNTGQFAAVATIAPGETWVETGLVALAGEAVNVYSNTLNGVTVCVFGQEVDNV